MDIHLTALSAADAAVMVAWRNDPEIADMVVANLRFVGLETEEDWNAKARAEHEAGRTIRLAIRLKENDRLIGMLIFHRIDHLNQHCVSGVLIGDKAMWGKGYAKKAYALALPYAFQELNMNAVRANILAHNTASQGLYRSLGFVHEGTQRAAMFKNGRFNDVETYSLLRSEFMAAQGK
jgi:RimJ/RimL family protein N-acetyltransferase